MRISVAERPALWGAKSFALEKTPGKRFRLIDLRDRPRPPPSHAPHPGLVAARGGDLSGTSLGTRTMGERIPRIFHRSSHRVPFVFTGRHRTRLGGAAAEWRISAVLMVGATGIEPVTPPV